MTEYKRYGRETAPHVTATRKAPRQLTATERQRAEQHRAAIHQHMPEMLPHIRELARLGLIDGWRNVVEVEINKDGQHESAHQAD